jgi:hypothetical protein
MSGVKRFNVIDAEWSSNGDGILYEDHLEAMHEQYAAGARDAISQLTQVHPAAVEAWIQARIKENS